MTDPILFSIVVPTYNRAHLISGTVQSILSQSYKNFELIIVDDGSSDNTEEVIKPFLSEKIFYFKKQNGERAAARNFGTLRAKGDYINWFDSDDIMFPNHLQEAAKMIAKNGRSEIFVQSYKHQAESGELLGIYTFSSDLKKVLLTGNPLANSPVIVRRDIALANPFNEDRGLSGSEDYELWLRLASRYPMIASPELTLALILHGGNSTVTMSDPQQLISRYTKFIQYTTADPGVVALLGKSKNKFVMKNYLLLAVDLAVNGHLQEARKYMILSSSYSPQVIFERGFYAFIKHYLRHSLS